MSEQSPHHQGMPSNEIDFDTMDQTQDNDKKSKKLNQYYSTAISG
jgi:hypothetical protein